ncbi:mannonate dehydratase [Thetidibacter halocola]|uniref:Mannonate dehydratase n=1 Tax=Thetidibacter halocola TaxID=2827239 RepID=A0A8J8B7Q6_9RHOB|nr:mannonate dehydratase [Thetidibacter halocola]MBS0125371.1 mannonate dehydratase [Thetidibacter halocola]
MKQTWRWFGPADKVTLSDVRQAGASGIVTALYDIRPGDVWPREAIAARKSQIEAAGLAWDVVESLPVSEAIRTGAPDAQEHMANWIVSLENLAAEGLRVICYNFMPVLDWTRTDLAAPMPSGARALRFDLVDFALFDLHVLRRPGAEADYTQPVVAAAADRARALTDARREALTATILAGLPGAVERWTLDSFRDRLASYDGIDADGLRANLATFLRAVVPDAQRLGMRLCAHPDDPPWPLFGLPRILSTEADYRWLVDVVPSPANGITLCTGSLGTRGDNDLPGMMARLGKHVHFLHLRNVRREDETVPGSFFEDEHLMGSTDMVAVIKAVVVEERRRRAEGRADHAIPMRPDHGQEILDDQERKAAPGYPAIGRLKGLAELRGVALALEHGA